MDVSLLQGLISNKTKAIIPVHLYGNMVDINEIRNLLKSIGREDITIIEDVAQAQGAKLFSSEAGTIGDYGAFSFYPSKNIGAIGDGGAVFCKDMVLKDRLEKLRFYGQSDRYFAEIEGGFNTRLDEIQASILRIKLKHIDKWNENKNNIVKMYRSKLQEYPIKFQKVNNNVIPAWHLCVISIEKKYSRDKMIQYLKEKGIGTLIHYPITLNKQKAFEKYCNGKYEISEDLVERILSIPMHTSLSEEEINYIVSSIKAFF
jgi:dTDP-4-amino-4,6-dideoxygalactose transaminase